MVAGELLLAHGEPAAGTPVQDLIPASIVGMLIVIGLVAFGAAHRSGRTRALTRLGNLAERRSGLPGWAALPLAIAGMALVVAVFGFYWDVATHIDNGRDPGPFANPSHFLIIAGLGGIALAGILSILLGCEESATSVRVRAGWNAPVGGVLVLVCGTVAVLGFPLDDVWHRLFGQDVTLWSPTHIQMVGGAALSTLALWILLIEGQRAAVDAVPSRRGRRIAETLAAGAVLVGASAFQAEFDYSVPQFRLLFHPVLLMLCAGVALVAARLRLGPGGALKAAGMFIVVRALLSIAIGPVMGHTTLHFPLYLIEALAVEAVALRIGTERQLTFGVAAGAAIGTFGLAAEWGWSHLWMTMAWPSSLAAEGIVLGFIAGVAGGAVGGHIGRALAAPRASRQRSGRAVALAAGLGVLAVLAYPLPTDAAVKGSATVRLTDASGSGGRWAQARISLEPPDLADGAEWFNVTAWQGGGSSVQSPRPISEGVFVTTEPLPVHGEWKALIRLLRGPSLVAVPIYLPKDEAIPAPEIPAEESFTRPFISDKRIVLREAKDVSSGLTYVATALLLIIIGAWIMSIGWGLHRLAGDKGARRGRLRTAPATSS